MIPANSTRKTERRSLLSFLRQMINPLGGSAPVVPVSSTIPDNPLREVLSSGFSTEFDKCAKPMVGAVDFSAKLICRRASDGNWELFLTNIKGSKVEFLLGRTFEEKETLSLNLLIPEAFHTMHNKYVASILNEGHLSEYWPRLFEKLSRQIKIRNPSDGALRLVGMWMCFAIEKDENSNQFIFDVLLKDATIQEEIANEAGKITHDGRGIVAAMQNTLDCPLSYSREEFINMPKEKLGEIYDGLKEIRGASDVLMSMFRPSRMDFTEKGIMQDRMNADTRAPIQLAKPANEIPILIHAARANRQVIGAQACEIVYTGHPNSVLEPKKIESLLHFLLNLIKNAIEAEANLIKIDFSEENGVFICKVTDNGRGMNSELAQRFFNRTFPQERTGHVKDNRGEGTLISYQDWHDKHGGEARVIPRKSNSTKGTCFILSISASILNQEQHHILNTIVDISEKEESKDKSFILLVDDTLFILRMLARQLMSYRNDKIKSELNKIELDAWLEKGITFDLLSDWAMIYAANGDIAYEIIKRMSSTIKGIITDQNMPAGNLQGMGLIEAVRHLESQKKTAVPIKIALNTADEADKMSAENKEAMQRLNVSFFSKGNKRGTEMFLQGIFEAGKKSEQTCMASVI